jgi:hypothetical protein
MKYGHTGWAGKALTDADRLEIIRTAAPEGTSVYFYGVRPPMPAGLGKPVRPGWYSACITQYPTKWYAEASSPIEAFRSALGAFRGEVAA